MEKTKSRIYWDAWAELKRREHGKTITDDMVQRELKKGAKDDNKVDTHRITVLQDHYKNRG